MKSLAFVAFLDAVLRVTLTLGQRTLALVAFDGVQPNAVPLGMREMARQLFGSVERIPDEARHVVAVVAGARGGKTYVSALRLLHLALTVVLRLAPGEQAYGVFVAPDLRLARQGLRYALGAAQSNPEIAGLLEDEGVDGFTLRRPDGHRVRLEALPATRGGTALRGRTLVGAVLDEAAFFRGEDAAVNDGEIFRAVVARIVPGGQVLIVSTPWAEAGLLYELHRENFGHAKAAICAHAPTSILREDARTLAMVARERERDPENCAREFDAEFMASGSGLFFDSASIEACVDRERVLTLPSDPDATASAGADFGFVSDSSALAIVFQRQDPDHDLPRVRLACLEEIRPVKGSPLQPSIVVGSFASTARSYGLDLVLADGHYREAIREHLAAHQLHLDPAPEGQSGKANTYLHLRKLINEQRLELPNHPRLVAQLKAIISKPTPGGGLSISSPRRAGAGHGDTVSALVLACWPSHEVQASGGFSIAHDGSRDFMGSGRSFVQHFGYAGPDRSTEQILAAERERVRQFWRDA